ncbi:actin cytoskeleton and mitosis protein, partial [Dimargaris xerosporica]
MPLPASAMQAGAMESAASKLEREQRFQQSATQDQYAALQIRRTQEREFCVRAGLIPGANDKLVLREASNLVGTCQDMCPLYERVERQHQNNIDKYEMIPGTRQVDPQRAVKAFHRSSAGNEQPLPSDVRPPDVLLRTLDYLIDEIVTSDQALADSHGFVRDRTRSIRTDFTLQNNRSLEAVEAHEQIARYHILCCHHLCHYEWFTMQQEKEQLGKVLQSLQEFYDDLAQVGIDCPNEPEFRAYHIIMNLFDNNMVRLAQDLDRRVFLSPAVQLALAFHSYAQFDRNPPMRPFPGNRQGSPFLFRSLFKLLASHRTPYLLGCMLELQLPIIRRNALSALNYSQQVTTTARFPTSLLVDYLGFDTVAEAVEYCAQYEVQAGPDFVELGRKDRFNKRIFRDPDMFPAVTKSLRLVEAKRQGLSLAKLIHGAQSAFGRPIDAPAALMTRASESRLPTHPPRGKPSGGYMLSHAMATDKPSRLVPTVSSAQGSFSLLSGAHPPVATVGAIQPPAKASTNGSSVPGVHLNQSTDMLAKPSACEHLSLASSFTPSIATAMSSSPKVSVPPFRPIEHTGPSLSGAPSGPVTAAIPQTSLATHPPSPPKPLVDPSSSLAHQLAPGAPIPAGPPCAVAMKPPPNLPPTKLALLLNEKEVDALASDIYQRLAQHELEALVTAVYKDEQTSHRQAQAMWCHALASGFLQGQIDICAYLTCIHHLAQARSQYRLCQRAFVIWRTRRAQ